MKSVYPLIMCGGVGTRLWPLSRVEAPKQFHRVEGRGSASFFQATVERHSGTGFHDPYVSVSNRYARLARAQLQAIGRNAELVIEETARHTGPAVLAAAFAVEASDPGALMAVLPSDHLIGGDFGAVVLSMRSAAEAGRIVLFGVHPAYAETGYGYIVDAGANADFPGAQNVSHFIEKPERELAERLISNGHAHWASGVSLFRSDVLISEYQRLDPDTAQSVRAAVENATRAAGGLNLDDHAFRKARPAATESVVFENSDRVLMTEAQVSWNDVGSWRSLYQIGRKDGDGNVTDGDVVAINSANSYIRAADGKLVATVGIENLAIVDTEDALLVASLDQTQDVPLVLSTLKERAGGHAVVAPKWEHDDSPPDNGSGYRLSEHYLPPGATLNLGALQGRMRVLTVCAGVVAGETGAISAVFAAGDTISVPPGNACLLHNTAAVAATVIELKIATADESGQKLAAGGDFK